MWLLVFLPLARGQTCGEEGVTEDTCKYNASFARCGYGLGFRHLAGQPQVDICQNCDFLTAAMGVVGCSFVPTPSGPPPPCTSATAIYNQENCEAMLCCTWNPEATNFLGNAGFCTNASCTYSPTLAPSAAPTVSPVAAPTYAPTTSPTYAPSASPTAAPTLGPTAGPTLAPTSAPTAAPTDAPTASPTAPTAAPTAAPTLTPTSPTANPTHTPTHTPTHPPTHAPVLIWREIPPAPSTPSPPPKTTGSLVLAVVLPIGVVFIAGFVWYNYKPLKPTQNGYDLYTG